MEHNRTSDVLGGSCNVIHMPSGIEVESARMHIPTDGGQHMSGLTRSGWREKLDTIKSRGAGKISSVRSSVRGSAMRAQNNLRSNPAKWAGAAVGAGFGVGLLGRLMLHRAQHRSMPEVIVISPVC